MQLIYLNKRTKIDNYKGKEVLNLCIYGSFEVFFDVNLSEYFNLIKPKTNTNFKDKYLEKIDNIAIEIVNNISNKKDKLAQVLSYKTFSKLAVSDNLVDKFWVNEQIYLFRNSEFIVFVDDLEIFNFHSSQRNRNIFFEILPYKQIYYFIIFIFNKICALKYNYKPNIKNNFKLFIGNKFEIKKNSGHIYEDYFFSKYWKNSSNSYLFLNIGDWNPEVNIGKEILFKESFLSFKDLINLLFVSLKHFFNPIQIPEYTFEDRLINRNLRNDVKSGSFIDSYKNFYIYSNLLKFLINKNGKLIIPHEGRSYERIICSVFEKTPISVIGYAHFPVSERILNYYYGKLENLIYNKFSFYTLSENNFDKFNELYKWPCNKIKIGSHLKRISINKNAKIYKDYDLLLLLGNELIQNLKLLNFVYLANLNTKLKILVRRHPSSRNIEVLNKNIKIYNFTTYSTTTLQDDVSRCKVILYGDTGASIDCLNFDIPLCYINDDNCFDSDRLGDIFAGHFKFYNINDFKNNIFKIINSNSKINFSHKINKYISEINPENFLFEN